MIKQAAPIPIAAVTGALIFFMTLNV